MLKETLALEDCCELGEGDATAVGDGDASVVSEEVADVLGDETADRDALPEIEGVGLGVAVARVVADEDDSAEGVVDGSGEIDADPVKVSD